MKKVLLLGDSICSWYTKNVREALEGKCEVYKMNDNGRYAAYTLWQAEEMFKEFGPFDVVHWNNGYWDMGGSVEASANPLKVYVYYLKKIIELCRKNGAKIIFATTTPLPGEVSAKDNTGTGLTVECANDRVIMFNDAAKKVMEEENIPVNDLYALCFEHENYYKCEDNLHHSPEGNQRCGEQVAKAICEVLGI